MLLCSTLTDVREKRRPEERSYYSCVLMVPGVVFWYTPSTCSSHRFRESGSSIEGGVSGAYYTHVPVAVEAVSLHALNKRERGVTGQACQQSAWLVRPFFSLFAWHRCSDTAFARRWYMPRVPPMSRYTSIEALQIEECWATGSYVSRSGTA